jgi:ribonuclease J
MNCLALQRGDDIIVIDCGVMFPGEELGVDVIHPDLSYLVENAGHVRAVLITHGHEDHIGGVPYVLRTLDVPIHAPPYALGLIRERLTQLSISQRPRLDRLVPGQPVDLGAFRVTPIRVTHSTADSLALAIRTPEHLVIHSGDFRIDASPVDGQHIETERFADLGRTGVDLLLSDSTNVEVPGSCGSEQSVAHTIEAAARDLARDSRVFVALFSSNTPRLQLMFEVAENLGRKVVIAGRSVHTHLRIASELGYVRYRHDHVIPLEKADEHPPGDLMFIMSGTQGERSSALGRLSQQRLRGASVAPGDLVVISGRFIPGNDLDIYRVIDGLARQGARVLHSRAEPGVHVSGHGHRGELRQLLELVKPRAFVPVHGTYSHLMRHADLAREVGVADIAVTENGEPVELGPDGLCRCPQVASGRVHVDGTMGVSELVLRDRRNLRNGFAVVVLAVDTERGEIVAPPQVVARGVGDEQDFPALWSSAADAVLEAISSSPARVRHDTLALRDTASRALRRFLSKTLDRRPTALAVVVELSAEPQDKETEIENDF